MAAQVVAVAPGVTAMAVDLAVVSAAAAVAAQEVVVLRHNHVTRTESRGEARNHAVKRAVVQCSPHGKWLAGCGTQQPA